MDMLSDDDSNDCDDLDQPMYPGSSDVFPSPDVDDK